MRGTHMQLLTIVGITYICGCILGTWITARWLTKDLHLRDGTERGGLEVLVLHGVLALLLWDLLK